MKIVLFFMLHSQMFEGSVCLFTLPSCHCHLNTVVEVSSSSLLFCHFCCLVVVYVQKYNTGLYLLTVKCISFLCIHNSQYAWCFAVTFKNVTLTCLVIGIYNYTSVPTFACLTFRQILEFTRILSFIDIIISSHQLF